MVKEAILVLSVSSCTGSSRRFPTFRTHAATSTDSLSRFTLAPELSLSFRTRHESRSADFLKMPSVSNPFWLMKKSMSYKKEKYVALRIHKTRAQAFPLDKQTWACRGQWWSSGPNQNLDLSFDVSSYIFTQQSFLCSYIKTSTEDSFTYSFPHLYLPLTNWRQAFSFKIRLTLFILLWVCLLPNSLISFLAYSYAHSVEGHGGYSQESMDLKSIMLLICYMTFDKVYTALELLFGLVKWGNDNYSSS